jgi:Protein of unknown function (DUF2892)
MDRANVTKSYPGGMCMKKYQNMGQIDRIIRFIVGTGLIIMLFLLESDWRYLGILGFKIDTRKKT